MSKKNNNGGFNKKGIDEITKDDDCVCSFCGKHKNQVSLMIRGDYNGYICSNCVEELYKINKEV